MISDLEDRERVLRGLDLGVNDFLVRPIDRNELVARVRTQISRKRYMDVLRNDVQASLEAALFDKLTNLHNRRYLETHLPAMLQASGGRGRPFSLMVLDIDYFKSVNDTYGHTAGDEVLKGFATRIKRVIRQADLVCRQGGEEFVVAMPDTSSAVASIIAERVRAAVQSEPFAIDGGARSIPVTVSIGLAEAAGDPNPETLFTRADKALYGSKHGGRNRVTADAA
jgi:two-component system cell cycle response regulator